MTLIELVERSATTLEHAHVAFGHGTTNAFDEAAWLVLWQLGMPLDDLDGVAGMAVSPEQQDSLHGVPFYVDERAIVPRSFIAELIVDGSLDAWLGEHTRRVLDLCTGNGSLAVLAAMAWPEVTVDAADISPAALEVARINVNKHDLQERIRLIESDGLRAVPGSYDLILCNPPYVNAQSMAQLPSEYRAEPELALAGGADGMDFIRGLLRDAPSHMNEQAVLVLEIGNERANFDAAFPRLEAVWLETSAGEDQVLLITRESLCSPGAATIGA
jgi:ribosomal protein L3 glutamine methyltransferase